MYQSLKFKQILPRIGSAIFPTYATRSTFTRRSLSGLTHIDEQTNQPAMVSIVNKQVTSRTATAQSVIQVPHEIAQLIADNKQTQEIPSPKGSSNLSLLSFLSLCGKYTSFSHFFFVLLYYVVMRRPCVQHCHHCGHPSCQENKWPHTVLSPFSH